MSSLGGIFGKAFAGRCLVLSRDMKMGYTVVPEPADSNKFLAGNRAKLRTRRGLKCA